jgi:hypothetical protein
MSLRVREASATQSSQLQVVGVLGGNLPQAFASATQNALPHCGSIGQALPNCDPKI